MASARVQLTGAAGAILAAEIVNYYLQPPFNGLLTAAGTAIPVTGTAFTALAVYRWHREEPAWWLLTASLGMFALAAVINLSFQQITGTPPFPGPADVPFLLVYPAGIAGLVCFMKALRLTIRPQEFLASLAVTVFAFWLLFYLVIAAVIRDADLSLLARVLTAVYPAADALLFSVVLVLLLAMAGRMIPVTYLLIAAGTVGLLAADAVFDYISLNWAWAQPSAIDAGWFFWYACWALAACLPGDTVAVRLLTRRRHGDNDQTARRRS